MATRWQGYTSPTHDELIDAEGLPRPAARAVAAWLDALDDAELERRRQRAVQAISQMGITFTVYSEGQNIDREWPFDIVPRVIDAGEWRRVEAGLEQRVEALNLFIDDVYNDRRIVRDGVVPEALLASSENFRPECVGVRPPHGVWAHVCGTDLVRDADGTLYVLEDNLRVPSGVSYMIENREIMKRSFPELFGRCRILPVDDYTGNLRRMLCSLSPREEPVLCVLTPGVYNSAYFEHAFLAQQIGAALVEGRDLVVDDDGHVKVRNVDGLERVDVIYRRVDDTFIDPEVFNPDSALGARGLMRAWTSGKVAIANAPGAGVADDKVVYSYVPEIIRYYLDAEPLIANVPTWRCERPDEREHVLANLDSLVVKPANASGGYGMLVGPHASAAEREDCARRVRADPRNFIAQPTLAISTAPTLTEHGFAPRHVDLRPFVLQGESLTVTTGGLTRVALVEGSLVVNSSQGGGSKDTWVVEVEGEARARTPSRPSLAQSQGSAEQSSDGRTRTQRLGTMSQSLGDAPSAGGEEAPSTGAVELAGGGTILARIAGNLFWLSRYLERAESTARLINVHDKLLMDLADVDRIAGWQSLVSIAGLDETFRARFEHADEGSVTRFLLADRDNPGSLINAADAIHANIRSSRDTLPQSLYERINALCQRIRGGIDGHARAAERQELLADVEQRLLAIAGATEGSLSHGTAYLLMRAGSLLERADMTSRILDVRATTLPVKPAAAGFVPFDELEWMSVLRSLSAYQMYRLHVRRPINGEDVLSFLLLDRALPRAYRFCLDELGDCLGQLGAASAPLDALARLRGRLEAPEPAALARDAPRLHRFIDSLQGGLAAIADAIAEAYFPPPQG